MPGLVARLITAARRRLTRRADRRATAHALTAHRRYWDDSVVLSLAELLQNAETKASGRVQILTLADFRAHIGEFWDTYAEKIVMIVETTIARMIGRGGTFIAQGDDTWLLLFPGLAPAEALERADAIAARIGEKLVGESFARDIPPPPLTVILEARGVVRADGSLDTDAFHAAVERARRPAKKIVVPSSKPAAQAVRHTGYTVLLRPGWSAETEVLDTFSLRPHGAASEDLLSDPWAVFNLAMAEDLCKAAAGLLTDMDSRKLRGRLALPLPAAPLLAGGGDRLRQELMAIPQRLRLLHLRVDLIQIPPDAATANVAALREAIRPLVREVGLGVDPAGTDNPLFNLDHVAFITEMGAATRLDDRQMAEVLKTLRRQAGSQRLAVGGLRARTQVLQAIALGINEIAGSGLATEQRHLPERLTVMLRSSFSP